MMINAAKLRDVKFRDYMLSPSGDIFGTFLDMLNDYGVAISSRENDFLANGYAAEDMESPSGSLGLLALWMETKIKGFEALRDEGFETIKATADLCEIVYHNNGSAEIEAVWCRRDGVCYVKYGETIQTIVASRKETKRKRNIEDASNAESALELMYEQMRVAA